jgi:hypothetical protein
MSRLVRVAFGAAAAAMVSFCGNRYGCCATPPRPDHGADRARGERTRAATGAAAEQDEHCGAADERENDDRQRVSGEPIEHEPSIVA